MKYARRNGSALLIVLGMFSFMLVSAVAFSIYMRSSRAPSSYVRRNVAARQLVKSALARAIDEVDCAIGNDPFPGVGRNHYYGERDKTPAETKGEFFNRVTNHKGRNDDWHGRVFTPLGEVAYRDTASTLTLEALGYLPPSLVNEVRFWSRHTRTAKWHSLNYGLGRYAFTAVNVSDFFDLGAFTDEARQYLNRSSAPHGRVSPTYLFRGRNEKDMTRGSGNAKAFLDALAEAPPAPSEVPIMSLMDFNMIYRNQKWAVEPPFLGAGGGYGYGDGSKISMDDASSQMFIAGGWNPNTSLPLDTDRISLMILKMTTPFGKLSILTICQFLGKRYFATIWTMIMFRFLSVFLVWKRFLCFVA